MADWNSELYLKFKAERTQPAHDLAARIPLRDARSILDIGCGPGNSTAAVAARYPGARVLGVDSSENMVAAACAGDRLVLSSQKPTRGVSARKAS